MEFWPRVAETLLTPPGIVIVLLVLTLLAYFKKHWLGTGMLVLSIVVLVALSLPRTGQVLIADLQGFSKPPELVPLADTGPLAAVYGPKDNLRDPPHAIVVLGAKRTPEAPEYDFQDTLGPSGLERVRYAAALQRKTRVPILVSGGAPGGETVSEAELMKAVLENEFRASVKWTERESRNTMENAEFSRTLLAEARVKHVYLVTHAWHMRRAARAFESVGIQVTPAPTGFQALTRSDRAFVAGLPSSWGMHLTSLAIRERLGFYWSGLSDESGAVPSTRPAPAK